MEKGFNCTQCKKWHDFGGYVAAHYEIMLTHTCDCGAKHWVQKGKTGLLETKEEAAKDRKARIHNRLKASGLYK